MAVSALNKIRKQGEIANPTREGTTTPSPCPVCRCPLFWRPFTRGPVYCATCHPPTNAKQWAMVVLDNAGNPKFIHHTPGNRDAGHPPEMQPTVPDAGTPAKGDGGMSAMSQAEYDAWWAANLPSSEAILAMMDLKEKRKKQLVNMPDKGSDCNNRSAASRGRRKRTIFSTEGE